MNSSKTPPRALIAPLPPTGSEAAINNRRRSLVAAAGAAFLTACGGGSGGSGGSDTTPAAPGPSPSPSPSPAPSPSPSPSPSPAPSPAPAPVPKRGIAYDLKDAADFTALSGPVGWWYNWALQPASTVQANPSIAQSMSHVPMLWNGNFDTAQVVATLKARPTVKHLLVLNEPNLVDQANLTPVQAAALWPRYEEVAAQTGLQIIGPAITWGTMSGYSDPVVWLDAFYAAYRANNGGRDPQIDALAFHWYDYGLGAQLDRLKKYGKPFWVTEMANWHSQNDGAQIDTAAKQQAQMADMVATCESRTDVVRYAWFTGRWDNDVHYTSLLAGSGVLTALGTSYRQQPTA
jgi:Glycosyl hydrolase catalytic core